MPEITRPGTLYYYDGLPAWTIRVPQPSRFRRVPYTLEFRAFKLAQGALLACIYRLYDIPDQPFYVHRVFDLSDDEVARYLKESEKSGLWVVEFVGGGEDKDCFRIASLKSCGFYEGCQSCLEYNENLGPNLNGPEALKGFLEVFEPAAQSSGWEAGWEAVAKSSELKT